MKKCRSMRQVWPETGGSLEIFQNTKKKLYVLCTNLFIYCIIKGVSKLINFGDELKKCRPLIQIFLYE